MRFSLIFSSWNESIDAGFQTEDGLRWVFMSMMFKTTFQVTSWRRSRNEYQSVRWYLKDSLSVGGRGAESDVYRQYHLIRVVKRAELLSTCIRDRGKTKSWRESCPSGLLGKRVEKSTTCVRVWVIKKLSVRNPRGGVSDRVFKITCQGSVLKSPPKKNICADVSMEMTCLYNQT